MTTTDAPADVRLATEPLAVDMREAARLLSISDDTLGRLVAAGEIRTFKIGALRRIAFAELRAFIARQEAH